MNDLVTTSLFRAAASEAVFECAPHSMKRRTGLVDSCSLMRLEKHELLDGSHGLEDLPDGILADALRNPSEEDLQKKRDKPLQSSST